jgi:hypothetical protein
VPGTPSPSTKVVDWKSVEFEEIEWESTKAIEKFNVQDAENSNIPLEKLVELLK